MVQEYVSPIRVHKHPFEMVMAAYERRFPSCPQIPVVLECAITEDSWSADDSQRDTTRRCQLNVEAPYLLKKMIGVDYVYFIQKNHLDLRARVLEIEATNETFAARVGVVEKCRYYVHPENAEWTCFEQSALLDVKNFFGLESTVEKIAMKQYAANITKGKELIEVFMKDVEKEGVTSLRPWSADQPAANRALRRVVSRNTEPLSPRPAHEPRKHSQPGAALRSMFKKGTQKETPLEQATPKKKVSINKEPQPIIDEEEIFLKSLARQKALQSSPYPIPMEEEEEMFPQSFPNRVPIRPERLSVPGKSEGRSVCPCRNVEEPLLASGRVYGSACAGAVRQCCVCPPSRVMTSWDSLVLVLICVLAFAALASPLTLYLRAFPPPSRGEGSRPA